MAEQWIEAAFNDIVVTQAAARSGADKEAPFAVQEAASDLLVSIGKRRVREVFEQLKTNFKPGQLPNIFVLNTMANLAEVNRT